MSDYSIFQQMNQVQPGTLTYPGDIVRLQNDGNSKYYNDPQFNVCTFDSINVTT